MWDWRMPRVNRVALAIVHRNFRVWQRLLGLEHALDLQGDHLGHKVRLAREEVVELAASRTRQRPDLV